MKEWMNGRLGPALIITATLVVVLAPVRNNWERKPQDDFPLSYYPMFSAPRGQKYSSPTLVGWTRDGRRSVVPYTFAGSGGLNEVRRQVRKRIEEHKADALCEKVARRVARSARPAAAEIERLQVITATHNLDAFFHGDKQPLKEKVHAGCPVVRERKSGNGPREGRGQEP